MKSATFYYRTIVNMILEKLPKTETLHYFADYMKNIIESGVEFTQDHLLFIINEIKPENMNTAELRYFRNLCKDFGVGSDILKSVFKQS